MNAPAERPDPGPDWTARYQAAIELTHEDAPGPGLDPTWRRKKGVRGWAEMVAYAGLNREDRRWFREETPDRAYDRLQAAAKRAKDRADRPDRACLRCGVGIVGTARRDKVRCDRCQAANRQADRRARSGPRPGQGARTDLASTSVTVYGAPPMGRGNNDSPALQAVRDPSLLTGSLNRQPGTPPPTTQTPVHGDREVPGEACPVNTTDPLPGLSQTTQARLSSRLPRSGPGGRDDASVSPPGHPLLTAAARAAERATQVVTA